MCIAMLKLNRATYMDKLHACWLGKNIGGTLGAPYEGSQKFLDVKGFATKKGEPLPNDDLDLQLVWLVAMESPMATPAKAPRAEDRSRKSFSLFLGLV